MIQELFSRWPVIDGEEARRALRRID